MIAAAGRLRLSNARIWQRPLVQASAAVAALLLLGAAAWSARSQSGEPPAQPTSAPAAVTAADTPRGASPSAPAAEPAPAAGVIEAVPSVLVGAVTFKAADHSGEIAAALVRSGLPAFVRSERSSGGYQVMIGPYLAVDEARALDEKLSALRITSPVVFTVGGSEPARSVPAGRLVSLTMEDRTTLALDARGPGLQATTQSADDTTFVADIGPLTEAARPEELEPAPGTPLVRHVSIRDAGRSDGTFIRVRVTLTSPSRASVRVAGQRVYIDFAPVTPLTPDPSRLPPMMREQPLVVAAAEAPIDSPSAPRPLSPPLPPLSSGPLVAAEVLHRASVLADRSDVKGLERLRGDVMQRAGSADQPADDLKRVLDELDRYTTQARTVQLERDARLFQRVENDRYRNAMRPILARLDRLQPALASAARRGPASTSVEQQLQTLSDIQGDVRAVAAPSAFAATHDRVQSALSLAADALTHPGDDAARKVAEAAALLNWARADLAGSRATDPPARN